MIAADLKLLLGKSLDYKGTPCEVIDVLEDDPSLVLRSLDNDSRIQADQYGEAHRRAPETFTVSAYGPDLKPRPLIEKMIENVKQQSL